MRSADAEGSWIVAPSMAEAEKWLATELGLLTESEEQHQFSRTTENVQSYFEDADTVCRTAPELRPAEKPEPELEERLQLKPEDGAKTSYSTQVPGYPPRAFPRCIKEYARRPPNADFVELNPVALNRMISQTYYTLMFDIKQLCLQYNEWFTIFCPSFIDPFTWVFSDAPHMLDAEALLDDMMILDNAKVLKMYFSLILDLVKVAYVMRLMDGILVELDQKASAYQGLVQLSRSRLVVLSTRYYEPPPDRVANAQLIEVTLGEYDRGLGLVKGQLVYLGWDTRYAKWDLVPAVILDMTKDTLTIVLPPCFYEECEEGRMPESCQILQVHPDESIPDELSFKPVRINWLNGLRGQSNVANTVRGLEIIRKLVNMGFHYTDVRKPEALLTATISPHLWRSFLMNHEVDNHNMEIKQMLEAMALVTQAEREQKKGAMSATARLCCRWIDDVSSAKLARIRSKALMLKSTDGMFAPGTQALLRPSCNVLLAPLPSFGVFEVPKVTHAHQRTEIALRIARGFSHEDFLADGSRQQVAFCGMTNRIVADASALFWKTIQPPFKRKLEPPGLSPELRIRSMPTWRIVYLGEPASDPVSRVPEDNKLVNLAKCDALYAWARQLTASGWLSSKYRARTLRTLMTFAAGLEASDSDEVSFRELQVLVQELDYFPKVWAAPKSQYMETCKMLFMRLGWGCSDMLQYRDWPVARLEATILQNATFYFEAVEMPPDTRKVYEFECGVTVLVFDPSVTFSGLFARLLHKNLLQHVLVIVSSRKRADHLLRYLDSFAYPPR